MKSIDVLFVSYGGSHAHMLKGVYSVVQKRFNVRYLALTNAEDVMKDIGLPYDSLNQFVTDTQNISDVLIRFGVNNDIENNYYTGIGLQELEESFSHELALELFNKYGRNVLCPTVFAKRILEYYQPKVLVTANIIRLPRALAYEARKIGIKSIYIEDLFAVPNLPFNGLDEKVREIIYPPISFDYIVTISEQVNKIIKRNLKSYFIDEAKLVALGNPNIEESLLKAESVAHEYSSSGGDDYVLFLSNKYERDKVTNFIKNYYKISGKTKLIIKTHPNEEENYYISKFNKFKNVKIESDKDSLVKLIIGARLVLATNSTAAFEAHLLGKDVYSLNPMRSKHIYDLYVNPGVTISIETIDQLVNLLDNDDNFSKESFPSIKIARNSVKNISELIIDTITS